MIGRFLLMGSAVVALAVPVHGRPWVREIVVENRDVVDPDAGYPRTLLYDAMNALHVRTRSYVVRREVLLSPGDPFDLDRLAESAVNIRRLSFIADATADTVWVTPDSVDVHIVTRDAWTTAVIASFGLDGGQERWALGVAEENLAGHGWSLRSAVSSKNGVRRESFGVVEPRLGGTRVRAAATFARYDPGFARALSASLPFATLDAPWSWSLAGLDAETPLYRYDAGHLESSQVRFRDRVSFHLAKSVGNDARFRFGVAGGWDDVEMGEVIRGGEQAPLGSTSKMEAVSFFVGFASQHYESTRNVAFSGRTEDFPVGHSWVFGAGPGSIETRHSGIVDGCYLEANGLVGVGDGRDYGGIAAGLRTYAGTPVGSVGSVGWADLRGFSQHFQDQTLGFRLAVVGSDGTDTDPAVIHVGGGRGPRGVPAFYQAGRKAAWGTLENRVLTPWRVATVRVGFTVFTDAGVAWDEGLAPPWNDVMVSLGGGLRLDPELSTDGGGVRLEFAVPVQGPGRGLPTIGVRASRFYHPMQFIPPIPRRLTDLLR